MGAGAGGSGTSLQSRMRIAHDWRFKASHQKHHAGNSRGSKGGGCGGDVGGGGGGGGGGCNNQADADGDGADEGCNGRMVAGGSRGLGIGCGGGSGSTSSMCRYQPWRGSSNISSSSSKQLPRFNGKQIAFPEVTNTD